MGAMDDANKMTDEILVELNPGPPRTKARPEAAPQIPDRPSETAPRGAWVDYLVAHGAERRFLESETQHWIDWGLGNGEGEYGTSPAFTRRDLVKLANEMGV